MQLATLERTDRLDPQGDQPDLQAFLAFGPAGLAALAGRVSDEQLPCRVNDPELFFADLPADVERAKTLCSSCPVRALCLTGALERREPWGVWGGEWFVQGVVVARKRPRGRPRKSEIAA